MRYRCWLAWVSLLTVGVVIPVSNAQQATARSGPGGGTFEGPRDTISEEQRQQIWEMLWQNIDTLRQQGKLPAQKRR